MGIVIGCLMIKSYFFHLNDKHTSKYQNNFSYDKCNKSFGTSTALQCHKKRHKPYKFTMDNNEPSFSHVCPKIKNKAKVFKPLKNKFLTDFEKSVISVIKKEKKKEKEH